MGIQVCENQGTGPYWGPNKGQKGVKFGEFMRSFSHELAVQIL